MNDIYVVKMHDILVPTGMEKFDEIFIVMEVCDTDMKKLTCQDVSLEPLHISALMINMLMGLKYIHASGIVHRDLKPANCLVNKNCSVKICDFGHARSFAKLAVPPCPDVDVQGRSKGVAPWKHTEATGLTGHIMTRWYRAPEVILSERYNQAVDIWSAGCIFAELLGMLDGTLVQDRGPLFQGSDACYPMSPARSNSNTRGQDQLEVILQVIGSPSPTDLACITSAKALKHVERYGKWPGLGFRTKIPRASDVALDLLSKMVCFNWHKRVSVEVVLNHDLFEELDRPSDNTDSPPEILSFDFDNYGSSEFVSSDMLREHFSKVINQCHG